MDITSVQAAAENANVVDSVSRVKNVENKNVENVDNMDTGSEDKENNWRQRCHEYLYYSNK